MDPGKQFASLKERISAAQQKKAASEARVEEHRKRAADLMKQLEGKGVPLNDISGHVERLETEVKDGLISVTTLLDKIPG